MDMDMIGQDSVSYRNLLVEEMQRRRGKNPAYSVRAMARDLGLSPAFMSQVISGKRRLSEEKAQSMASRLSWSRPKTRLFLGLVRVDLCRDPKLRSELRDQVVSENVAGKGKRRGRIVENHFPDGLEWHHFALIEMADIPGLLLKPRTVARRLDIPLDKVLDAIRRLVLAGHLVPCETGFVLSNQEFVVRMTPKQIKDDTRRSMLRAERALDQGEKLKDVALTTMAINPRYVKRARVLIRKFHFELAQFLSKGPKSRVFQFSSQLVPVESGED